MAQSILIGKSRSNRFARKSLASRIADLKLGNLLNPESHRAFSSISGSVSKKKSATRDISTRRRRGGTKKKGMGKNKRNMSENKNVHIGIVSSSDTVGTRV